MSRRYRRKKANSLAIIVVLVVILVAGLTALGFTKKDFIILFIIIAVTVLGIGIFAAYMALPSTKGKRGEKKVARILDSLADKYGGYTIHDVIVPGEDGHTSQIDHILFTRSGIFVVETKNYAGRVYGNASHREWTQVLAYGNTKNKLYNPLMQNKTHVYRLAEIIGKKMSFVSCVVFARSNTEYIDAAGVFTPRELKSFIRDQLEEEKYTISDVLNAYKKIQYYKENPVKTTKEHVKSIKIQQKALEHNICPRCGSDLVLRKGKDGSVFYGCSKYPKCKFTKKA